MTELEPAALPVLMHRRALPKDQRKAEVADAAEAKLAGPLGVLDGALRTRPYLLGDTFTAADLNVASVAVWAAMGGVDLSKTPNAAAWLGHCTERPSCKAAQG
jgi:glutathione S-transferase